MGEQGQSFEATIDKERCLGSALAIGMSIATAKFSGRGFCYWHFDANAGSGWNRQAGVDGSPVVFHRIADAYLTGLKRQAFFCDLNAAALDELSKRLGRWPAYLFGGDNEEAIEVFAERIRQAEKPHFALGSVIVDPNGYWYRNAKGEGAPVKALTRFAAEFPRIDIVLNLNTRSYKLQRAQGHDVKPPIEVLASLHKTHWLVRRTQAGGDQFLLAVGRNVETGDHKRLGFHKLASVEGNHIMAIVEGERQKGLFDAAPVQQLR
jgi:hypothetical protein